MLNYLADFYNFKKQILRTISDNSSLNTIFAVAIDSEGNKYSISAL